MPTRTRIIRASRRLFDEKGLEELSLRSVARRVGITPMAIYRHFDSKEALVDALVLDGLAQCPRVWTRCRRPKGSRR